MRLCGQPQAEQTHRATRRRGRCGLSGHSLLQSCSVKFFAARQTSQNDPLTAAKAGLPAGAARDRQARDDVLEPE